MPPRTVIGVSGNSTNWAQQQQKMLESICSVECRVWTSHIRPPNHCGDDRSVAVMELVIRRSAGGESIRPRWREYSSDISANIVAVSLAPPRARSLPRLPRGHGIFLLAHLLPKLAFACSYSHGSARHAVGHHHLHSVTSSLFFFFSLCYFDEAIEFSQ
jgi:hypothetical protein